MNLGEALDYTLNKIESLEKEGLQIKVNASNTKSTTGDDSSKTLPQEMWKDVFSNLLIKIN